MNITPVSIAVCNQKGGVGKSTFTVLLASYLHYTVGYDMLVVDCDYPQWSIHAQRERELEAVGYNDYYKLLMVRQFKATGRRIWPSSAACPPKRFGRSTASCKAATARGSSSTTSRERSMPKELSPASHRSFIKRPFLAF